MFGLFKPKMAPEGPVEITGVVHIERPPAEVYALIDWADERNAKRATGNLVTQIEGNPARFDMVMPMMDDLTFEMLVTEAEPHRKYAFGCVIRPGCGNMAHNHECYEFEDDGKGGCNVILRTETTFVEGLRMREFTCEVSNVAVSIQSALQKLKLQAEHGAEFAKAIERNTLL